MLSPVARYIMHSGLRTAEGIQTSDQAIERACSDRWTFNCSVGLLSGSRSRFSEFEKIVSCARENCSRIETHGTRLQAYLCDTMMQRKSCYCDNEGTTVIVLWFFHFKPYVWQKQTFAGRNPTVVVSNID